MKVNNEQKRMIVKNTVLEIASELKKLNSAIRMLNSINATDKEEGCEDEITMMIDSDEWKSETASLSQLENGWKSLITKLGVN